MGASARRGSALLAVLWLSAALGAIAFSLAATVRGEIAWCQGAIIWRTVDGGRVWHYDYPLITGGTEFSPVGVQFTDETTGWLIYVAGHEGSNGTTMGFALSDDGGASWTTGAIPELWACLSSNMLFLDARHGWIGDNCPRVHSLVPRQDFLNGMFPPRLIQTDDGGRTWKDRTLPMPKEFPAELSNPVVSLEPFVFCGITNLELISEAAFSLDWNCSVEGLRSD